MLQGVPEPENSKLQTESKQYLSLCPFLALGLNIMTEAARG